MFRMSLALALAMFGNAATAQPTTGNAGLLVDTAGKVLYVFDKDTEGRSVCVDQCAALWPPFAAPADVRASGAFSVITRPDGSRQWAVRGRPLYYYAGDTAAGQTTGDGRGGVWHVVREGAPAAAQDAGTISPKGY